MAERRREKRLRARLPVRIGDADGQQIYARTENISILGTYIEIEQEIPLGKKIDLSIEIPSYTNDSFLTGNVGCRGDVFRCDLIKEIESRSFYGVGIFFIDFPDGQDRNKLLKYIEFLILKEQENIKRAMRQWREKRSQRRAKQKD